MYSMHRSLQTTYANITVACNQYDRGMEYESIGFVKQQTDSHNMKKHIAISYVPVASYMVT